MIGDGINDSPALSEADAGIAMGLMERIHGNYRSILSFNTLLIVLGMMGILQPTATALLHNSSTVLIGMRSMTDLLPKI